MTQQAQTPKSTFNWQLPFAAFALVLVGGGIVAFIIKQYNVDAAMFVFGVTVMLAVLVALGIVFEDRAEFREMSKAEQAHTHRVQIANINTDRIKIRNQAPVLRLPENTPPDANWQAKQLPQAAQTLQKVDATTWRVMPTVPVETRNVRMSDGTIRTVKLSQLEALFKLRPVISQDGWLKNGGGDVAKYGEVCELLCASEPTLLLRKPGAKKGYEWSGDNAFIANWWDEVVNDA